MSNLIYGDFAIKKKRASIQEYEVAKHYVLSKIALDNAHCNIAFNRFQLQKQFISQISNPQIGNEAKTHLRRNPFNFL